MKKYRFAVTLVLPDDHGYGDVRKAVEDVLSNSETICAVECQLDVELVDTTERAHPDINWNDVDTRLTDHEEIVDCWNEEAQRFLQDS